jgi:hypothetical protein
MFDGAALIIKVGDGLIYAFKGDGYICQKNKAPVYMILLPRIMIYSPEYINLVKYFSVIVLLKMIRNGL